VRDINDNSVIVALLFLAAVCVTLICAGVPKPIHDWWVGKHQVSQTTLTLSGWPDSTEIVLPSYIKKIVINSPPKEANR
jgi:hypothetical protein